MLDFSEIKSVIIFLQKSYDIGLCMLFYILLVVS